MHLTKKHFELLAGALRRARQQADAEVLEGVDVAAEEVATTLSATNNTFDRQRFLLACGHGQLFQLDHDVDLTTLTR